MWCVASWGRSGAAGSIQFQKQFSQSPCRQRAARQHRRGRSCRGAGRGTAGGWDPAAAGTRAVGPAPEPRQRPSHECPHCLLGAPDRVDTTRPGPCSCTYIQYITLPRRPSRCPSARPSMQGSGIQKHQTFWPVCPIPWPISERQRNGAADESLPASTLQQPAAFSQRGSSTGHRPFNTLLRFCCEAC